MELWGALCAILAETYTFVLQARYDMTFLLGSCAVTNQISPIYPVTNPILPNYLCCMYCHYTLTFHPQSFLSLVNNICYTAWFIAGDHVKTISLLLLHCLYFHYSVDLGCAKNRDRPQHTENQNRPRYTRNRIRPWYTENRMCYYMNNTVCSCLHINSVQDKLGPVSVKLTTWTRVCETDPL